MVFFSFLLVGGGPTHVANLDLVLSFSFSLFFTLLNLSS